jgi:propanol-preferring alcohol dehydrogenase
VKYPLTLGHEIAGIVDSLGEEAEGFSKNEKVLVYPWIGEGLCPPCRIGEENDKPRSLGIYTDGGLCTIRVGSKLHVSSENRR